MLKIAGWIISDSAVDAWRQAHAELNDTHPVLTTGLKAESILHERDIRGLHPLPFSKDQIISVSWPKMTKQARGTTVCILVRRVDFNAKNETWDSFSPILQKFPRDQEMVDALKADGLELGEWVTVPDPFENDWPFEKRYPGARYPPELNLYDGSFIALPLSKISA